MYTCRHYLDLVNKRLHYTHQDIAYIHVHMQALSRLSEAAERKVVKLFGSGDSAKLTQALAESMLIRSIFLPVTMPLKMWLTYVIVA